jgi:hypothetical protein
MDLSNMLAIGIPLTALVAAAVPLCCLRSFRRVVLGCTGSGCIGMSAAIVGLMSSGLVPLPGQAVGALADDKAPETDTKTPLAGLPPLLGQPAAASDPFSDILQVTVEIPPGRPEWVGSEPDYSGKVHTVPVASGPYALAKQAERALDGALVKATNRYIAEQLDSELAPRLLHYDVRRVKDKKSRHRIVKETYHDVARYSIGPMHENFALLEFGPEFREELTHRWDKVRATSRLVQTGFFAGAALLLVGSVFGYFRLDNATRGYYTGRLQFMTAAAILTIVGAGVLLARWITWL